MLESILDIHCFDSVIRLHLPLYIESESVFLGNLIACNMIIDLKYVAHTLHKIDLE